MTSMPASGATLLTIAGFDPSSGAGIAADLQVFAAHRNFGISAITALTVQSTQGVFAVESVPAHVLQEMLFRLDDDLPADAIKIGMLSGAPQVRVVAQFLSRRPAVPVVLDPVLRSSSGRTLLDAEGIAALRGELLPLVSVVTPNWGELEVLSGMPCGSAADAYSATQTLAQSFPQLAVVATGGDRDPPDDLLWMDGVGRWLAGERIDTTSTHGTGCAFSSAIACGLAAGMPLPESVAAAKVYVAEAMRRARPRGKGRGPLHLAWTLY